MPTSLTEESKNKILGAYQKFRHKISSIKSAHFKNVDRIQKDADLKFASSIKQTIEHQP